MVVVVVIGGWDFRTSWHVETDAIYLARLASALAMAVAVAAAPSAACRPHQSLASLVP